MNRLKQILLTLMIVGFSFETIQSANYQKPVYHWKQLTLRQKIAQMIMVRIRGDFYNSENWYQKSLQKWIEEDGVGGVITFGGSIHGTFHNIKTFQSWSNIPLLVAADYERGMGQWMSGATLFPSNMALTATGNIDFAYQQGTITANESRSMGVHIALAPVMDVNNNSENPIINFRSYSDDPTTVSEFGTSFIKGIQDGGIFACVKHYPGHGNTSTDSHTSLPTINGSRDSLLKIELPPFQSAVNAGVKMVMIGHIAMPGLDDSGAPASHSKIITTDLLRYEMGFKGIIITDGMEMGGLTKSAWAGESAVRAVEAGADILLLPMDVVQTIDAIEKAVNSGRIFEDRINESVDRIWTAKMELDIDSHQNNPSWTKVENNVGTKNNMSVAQQIADASITIVKDDYKQLPIKPEKIKRLTHMILSTDEGAKEILSTISADINRTHSRVNEIFIHDKLSEMRIDEIITQLANSNQIIVSLLVRIRMDKGISTIDVSHAKLLKKIREQNKSTIVISFGSPYLPDYQSLPTYLCAYGYGGISQKAAANIIWGRRSATGKLPVDLNSKYKKGDGITISQLKSGFETDLDLYDFSTAWTILDSAINEKIFPGAQVLIIKSGQIIASDGFGYQIYDSSSPPIDTESIYDVASLTKILTTTPITLKLISQKKLNLDLPISQFYSEVDKQMTIRHLMTHSSGLKPFKQYFFDTSINSQTDIIYDIINQPLDFSPGSEVQYSDLGIILMMDIIERVSNSSLKKLSDSWIFHPLGMKNTMFNPSNSLINRLVPTEVDNIYRKSLVHGIVHDENTDMMGGVSGHAGVFSTAEDIGKLAQLFLNEGVWMGKRLLNSSLVRQFIKRQNIPSSSDRAIGWDTPSQNGKSSAGDYFSSSSYGHLGFTGTSLWIDPEKEIIVVLLTNRVHPSRDKEGIYGIRRAFHNAVMKKIS